MPFALLIVGLALLVAAVRDKQSELFTLIKGDFTGPNNFVYWITAMLVLGSLGYIPKLKPLSVGLLVLVVLVLILTKGNPSGIGGGLFQQLASQLGSTQTATATAPAATGTTKTPSILDLPGLPTLGNF